MNINLAAETSLGLGPDYPLTLTQYAQYLSSLAIMANACFSSQCSFCRKRQFLSTRWQNGKAFRFLRISRLSLCSMPAELWLCIIVLTLREDFYNANRNVANSIRSIVDWTFEHDSDLTWCTLEFYWLNKAIWAKRIHFNELILGCSTVWVMLL